MSLSCKVADGLRWGRECPGTGPTRAGRQTGRERGRFLCPARVLCIIIS